MFSKRILTALESLGMEVEDTFRMTEEALLELNGIGPKAVQEILTLRPQRKSQRERKILKAYDERFTTVLEHLEDLEDIMMHSLRPLDVLLGKEVAEKHKAPAKSKLLIKAWPLVPKEIRLKLYQTVYRNLHIVAAMDEPAELVVTRLSYKSFLDLAKPIVTRLENGKEKHKRLKVNSLEEEYTKVAIQYAEMIIKYMQYVKAYSVRKDHRRSGLGDIKLIKVPTNSQETEYWRLKRDNEPKPFITKIESSLDGTYQNMPIYCGGTSKVRPVSQSQATIDVLNSYRTIGMQINEFVANNKFIMSIIYSTFPSSREVDKFKEWVEENRGKTLYIQATRLVPDNGRVDLGGYLGGIQVGFRKILLEPVKQEILRKDTIEEVERRVADLENGNSKEKAYALMLQNYLLEAYKGLPTSCWLNLDNRMSGVQNMAHLTKSLPLAIASGMTATQEDGRNTIKDLCIAKWGKTLNVEITKVFVKEGMRGLMYGGGEGTISGAIAEEFPKAKLPDNFTEVFKAMVYEVFPDMVDLIEHLYGVAGMLKDAKVTHANFTNASGVNCTITALDKVNLVVNTLLGNDRKFNDVKVLNYESWGAKIVAAGPQSNDSAILFDMKKELDCDLITIHDDYVFLANNYKKVDKKNVEINKRRVTEDNLTSFVDQITAGCDYKRTKYAAGTLVADDIMYALYE